MELQKNAIVTVTIEDIGTEGEGIGKVDGFTLFVKDAVVGDTVEAKIMLMREWRGFYSHLLFVLRQNVLITDNAVDASFRRFPMKSSLPLSRRKSGIT